jgi:hypothetical protein
VVLNRVKSVPPNNTRVDLSKISENTSLLSLQTTAHTSKDYPSHIHGRVQRLGLDGDLAGLQLEVVAAHCGVSVADREIRSLGRLALQPPNGHVADGVAPGDVGQSFAVRHSLASLGLLGGCQLVFPPQALAPGLGAAAALGRPRADQVPLDVGHAP